VAIDVGMYELFTCRGDMDIQGIIGKSVQDKVDKRITTYEYSGVAFDMDKGKCAVQTISWSAMSAEILCRSNGNSCDI